MPVITLAWLAARWAGLGNAVRAGLVGGAALVLILMLAGTWHWLSGPASHHQTAEDVAIAVANASTRVLGETLARAEASEKAAAFARDAATATDIAASDTRASVERSLVERAGAPVRVLDDRTLDLLRKP